jgi:hypothetical protein
MDEDASTPFRVGRRGVLTSAKSRLPTVWGLQKRGKEENYELKGFMKGGINVLLTGGVRVRTL